MIEPREVAFQVILDEITLTNKQICKNIHKVVAVFIYVLNLHPHVRFAKVNSLLSMVIPGGYLNEELNTFLWPLVNEFKHLSQTGVTAKDASRPEMLHFQLRSHLILVTGDGRAIAKAMGMQESGNANFHVARARY